MTNREFLEDPRGSKRHCAFCKYFKLTDDPIGYGECEFPDDLVKIPSSYRAEYEGTAAYYGENCTFFERGKEQLPDWKFLDQKSPVIYGPFDPEAFK